MREKGSDKMPKQMIVASVKSVLPVGAILLSGVALFTGSAMAQADPPEVSEVHGFYAGGAVGQSIFWDIDDVEFDLSSFMISVLGGYRLDPNLRMEGEFLYESAENKQGGFDLEITRLLGTAYYDFAPNELLRIPSRPYAGAGAGLANLDNGNGDDELELTVHGEVGISVPISGNLELVPGVRVSYTTLDGGGDDVWVTQLRAGFRYAF